MANPDVILTALASESVTKVIPPLTDAAAGIGRMSQQQGFPPVTQQPLELGGKAPQRDDFNGAFNLLSQHTLFLQSGGQYLYNPELTYNLGNIIALDDGITLVQSLTDNNPTNPNAGLGVTWRVVDATEQSRIWARRFDGQGLQIFADAVLSPAGVGKWFRVMGAFTVTLPSADAVEAGSTFVIINSALSGNVTINSLDGLINFEPTLQIAPEEIIELASNKVSGSGWVITSRSSSAGQGGGAGGLIGAPIPYPLVIPPEGYLLMAGQAFAPVLYPLLALAYPSHILPDLRGEFIRGLDNGRGVDPGRAILSWAPDMLIAHDHPLMTVGTGNNILDGGGVTAPTYGTSRTGATGGTETRPRSVAFNYICRAL